MGSLKRDICAMHPEQRELLDLFENVGHRHNYYDIFNTLIDYFIHQYTAPEDLHSKEEFNFPSKYDAKEQSLFKAMLQEVLKLCYKKCSLWQGFGGWYDPFGNLFENVGSNFARQKSGQFFTPPTICDLMAQVIVQEPNSENIGSTCIDPCCGSGRLLLASNNINPGLYHIGNDIDPLCAKMTAVNFCLNGVIGEVTCNDGLFSIEKNHRFGFKVVPLLTLFNQNSDLVNMIFSVNPHFKKQFCLLPLKFEDCQIQMKVEKQEFFKSHVQTHVEHRNEIHPEGLQGVLFESEKINKEKKKGTSKESHKQKVSTEDKFNLLFEL